MRIYLQKLKAVEEYDADHRTGFEPQIDTESLRQCEHHLDQIVGPSG